MRRAIAPRHAGISLVGVCRFQVFAPRPDDDDVENSVVVSAASAWEITTKYRIGKLPDARVVADDVSGAVAAEGFNELAISMRHAQRAGNLIGHHQDPFDRMLIAQALLEDLTLVSNERAFDAYGVRRLW